MFKLRMPFLACVAGNLMIACERRSTAMPDTSGMAGQRLSILFREVSVNPKVAWRRFGRSSNDAKRSGQ